MFIFHWGYWFAVKQVTFKELVSLYCNLPCLEWLSGVCFGQRKQLYKSKKFKEKKKNTKKNSTDFLFTITHFIICKSPGHISVLVTRKLAPALLHAVPLQRAEKEIPAISFYFFLCSIRCLFILFRILPGFYPKCRELSSLSLKCVFNFWKKKKLVW